MGMIFVVFIRASYNKQVEISRRLAVLGPKTDAAL